MEGQIESAIISAYLATPASIGRGIMLDGLVAGELAGQAGDAFAEAIQRTAKMFAQHETSKGPIAHCSISIIEVLAPEFTRTMTRRFRLDDAIGIAPDHDIVDYSRSKHRDAMRNLFNKYEAIPARAIHWIVEGDVDAILSVVQPLEAIGKNRARGWGQVTEWVATPVAGRAGLRRSDGQPARVIPLEDWRGIKPAVTSESPIMPRYWQGQRHLCAAPPRPVISDGERIFDWAGD